MINYLVRRALYSLLVLAGINFLTFFLFFSINTPDDMARLQLGGKRVAAEAIERWKAEHGYDKPLYLNLKAGGTAMLTRTVFVENSLGILHLKFGKTLEGRDIAWELGKRVGPTLAMATPVFIIAVGLSIVFALGLMLFRYSTLDTVGVVALVALMSISSLFFIITGQYVFGKLMALAPLSDSRRAPACSSSSYCPLRCTCCRNSDRTPDYIAPFFWKNWAVTMCGRPAPRDCRKSPFCSPMSCATP